MKAKEKILETLHDLIRINKDRLSDYEKAVRQTTITDTNLATLFSGMATESRLYANELGRYLNQHGDEARKDTTVHGKIYRLWMDIKVTFSGHDRRTILSSMESVEHATQKIYEEVLASNPGFPAGIKQLIMDQKSGLLKLRDRIKRMRNALVVQR